MIGSLPKAEQRSTRGSDSRNPENSAASVGSYAQERSGSQTAAEILLALLRLGDLACPLVDRELCCAPVRLDIHGDLHTPEAVVGPMFLCKLRGFRSR
jgi:hypothetical protein